MKATPKKKTPPVCLWKEDSETNSFLTQCGDQWLLDLGIVVEFKCCCYCGAPIKVQREGGV